ncbi:MAG TPA: hypothetical protein VF746_11095 [Longimicrobium sp.]|jgi:hypothetical protein
MSETFLHPLPARGPVVREQFRSVGLSLRREALAVGGILGIFTGLTAWARLNGVHGMSVDLVPEAGIPVFLLALFAPLAVWKGEAPGGRGYHLSMPVPHGPHALLKSASGLLWLLAAVVGYLAWLGVMAVATGGDIGRSYYGPHGYIPTWWRWAAIFTGAVTMYGLGTALALRTVHPWRWLAGGAFGYLVLSAWNATSNGENPLYHVVRSLWSGRYGLGTALTGIARGWGYHYGFGASTWLTAAWLWLGIAVAVAVIAAYNQPER